MFLIKFHEKNEKPKYGKVIALTAVAVAAVEALAFIGIAIAKKVSDSKRAKENYDDDFIMIPHTDDCSVEFEDTTKSENE